MSSPISAIDENSISEEKIADNSTLDGFEDAESEADWADGLSLHGSETVICGYSDILSGNGNYNYLPRENNSFVEELFEKNKSLERRLNEAEKKCSNLRIENDRLNMQLINEKQKSVKYYKKFKYIQDNQEIFDRLKQTYLSMKYNESAGRPLIEVREKAIQTWDGILCRACLETSELNREKQFEALCQFTSSPNNEGTDVVFSVKKQELEKIDETVKKLREMINKRELSWSYNKAHENQLKITIVNLEMENERLKDLLKIKECKHPTTADVAGNSKEIGSLKKIIVKMEKRRREMEKKNLCQKLPTPLNDVEIGTVDQIMAKYYKRVQKHNENNARSKSCDRPGLKNKNNSSSFLQPVVSVPNTARKTPKSGNRKVLGTAGGDSDQAQNMMKNNPNNKGKESVDLIDFTENTTAV